jgi:hypothetical protein
MRRHKMSNKEMAAVASGLFLVTSLVLTACQSSLALGRAEESPLLTPTVWPEWLPLPATDIWSVPPRPATLVPAEGRVHPTPAPVSPLPAPTPLPGKDVRVTAFAEIQTLFSKGRLIAPDFDAQTIVIIARDSKSIIAVDAITHRVHVLNPRELMDSQAEIWLPAVHISGRFVVWVARWQQQGALFVYDLHTGHLSFTQRETSLADADLSGHIVIWRQLGRGAILATFLGL